MSELEHKAMAATSDLVAKAGVPARYVRAVAVGALLAAGAAVLWWLWERGTFEPAPPDDGGDPVTPQDSADWMDRVTVGPGKVVHRERADGTDQRLQDFLDWWEANGSFIICVCPDGGVRTDEALQASLFAKGTSHARTLADTPHGRAGGLDVAPYYNHAPQWGDLGPFQVLGDAAKARGLAWGGDFTTLQDYDHLEVPDWRALPFPPPAAVS